MSFSAIMQIGMGTLGALQAGQQYKDGLNARYEALRMQRDQYAQQYGGYLDALRAQQEENARLKTQAEQEKRDLASQAASRISARRSGGARMLLSDTRLTPEAGVEQTLGSKGMGA